MALGRLVSSEKNPTFADSKIPHRRKTLEKEQLVTKA